MKYYYIESFGGSWFIVKCKNKSIARKEGIYDFGKNYLKDVRIASENEIEYFESIKGKVEEID